MLTTGLVVVSYKIPQGQLELEDKATFSECFKFFLKSKALYNKKVRLARCTSTYHSVHDSDLISYKSCLLLLSLSSKNCVVSEKHMGVHA